MHILENALKAFAASLCALALPASSMAWGAGHDVVNELAYGRMPQEIRQAMPQETKELLAKWSHTPDDFTPWEKLAEKYPLDDADRAFLATVKMAHPYSMHYAKGQAVATLRLAIAFEVKDYRKAAFWMACLLHVMADESACNHDPLLEYMLCAFKEYNLKLGKGSGFDIADIAKTPEGKSEMDAIMAKTPLKTPDPQASPSETLQEILEQSLQGNAFLTRRGSVIAASFALQASPSETAAARKALAEIGVEGMDRGLFAICAAWNWAQAKSIPEYSHEAEKIYEQRKNSFIAKRPLSDDSLFAPLLAGQAGKGAAIGILVEPSISMNEASLSFSAKYISASIMRTLSKEGIPYLALDLRELEKGACPSPERMPALALCAGPLKLGPEAAKALGAYAAKGGKLLCIGGEHKGLLGDVSAALKPMPEALLPVSPKYGAKSEALPKTTIEFRGLDISEAKDGKLKFVRDPNTKIGWHQPKCRYMLDASKSGFETLASLLVDGGETPVAGIANAASGAYGSAFVPEYLVAPYLLCESAELPKPAEPELDPVARQIVLQILAKQAPELFKGASGIAK